MSDQIPNEYLTHYRQICRDDHGLEVSEGEANQHLTNLTQFISAIQDYQMSMNKQYEEPQDN